MKCDGRIGHRRNVRVVFVFLRPGVQAAPRNNSGRHPFSELLRVFCKSSEKCGSHCRIIPSNLFEYLLAGLGNSFHGFAPITAMVELPLPGSKALCGPWLLTAA